MTAPRACPVCESDQATRLDRYSPSEWDLVACDGCGFVFLRNPPPYEALEEDFAWEKTYEVRRQRGGSTRFSRWLRPLRDRMSASRNQSKQDVFRRLFGAGRVLDVGCGDIVRTEPPIVPYGIEISNVLQAGADEAMRAQGGYCLKASGADGVWEFDEEFFDGVILNSYLEHEADPRRVLGGIHRALKPGGKVFVRVPNFGSLNRRVIGAQWCGFRHPDHVNYFTTNSLERLAGKFGFGVQILNKSTLWVDDNIKAVLHRI
ncbi:class I SAM-dependent methyltransferase [Lutimaribacter sp. EGI FJ00015]|uniref:Class I SAM-dependent methyltransferase n=1 Tax=Lutimaribacter degradans TaxID=2945989 RepID=A0ACC5ZZV7_9RHOB|nr:class I SAM-dependent methyltransferase [Lutimaribacter sp. EGI FJ00013]MCM2563448.1 class I SAM-dependent methyltransferase [Lutimaribacter sp. EGI FJ00013]MCO0614628.1 class I SAM-dependent methyltransferase [Lutimaribacter sp. EGI FJ00015]MCO0637299.1 class I SAM-dependent methyltransferase [Lutimaribacter sp. EGI FJ00014]